MKTRFTLLTLSWCLISLVSSAQSLIQVWDSGPVFKTPESVLYDHQSGHIFVSNINNSPGEKDGNGFISLVNTDGTVNQLEWVKGLNAPKGMAVWKGKLYVSDIDELVEIDITEAAITNKYPIEGATFLNDVAVCGNGTIFVSGSASQKVYALDDGKIATWFVPDIGRLNGLLTDHGKLYIASDQIVCADIKTKEVEVVQTGCNGIDGIEKDNKGNIVFSNWAGRIVYLKDGVMTEMLNSSADKINTADLDFAKEMNLLLVPTFFDNRVVAYRIE